MAEKNLKERFRTSKANEEGFVTRKQDGIIETFYLGDANTDDIPDIIAEYEDSLNEDELRYASKTAGELIKGNNKVTDYNDRIEQEVNKFKKENKSSALVQTLKTVIAKPELRKFLVKGWYKDSQYVNAVANLVIKHYDFEKEDVIKCIGKLYNG